MAKYIAKAQTWLSHENRMVKADEVFTTTFPKVMVAGKLVDMKLGENIEAVEDEVVDGRRKKVVTLSGDSA